MRNISKLGDHLGEHAEQGLTDIEQCEDVAKFISKISQEYEPLSDKNLPKRVTDGLADQPCSGHPVLDDHYVYEIMKNRKLTSGVSGDLHPKIMKECMVELSNPVGVILRDAVETHTWP